MALESGHRKETGAWPGQNHAHQLSFQSTVPGPGIPPLLKTDCFMAITKETHEMLPQNGPPWTSDSEHLRKSNCGEEIPRVQCVFQVKDSPSKRNSVFRSLAHHGRLN